MKPRCHKCLNPIDNPKPYQSVVVFGKRRYYCDDCINMAWDHEKEE